MKLEQIQKVQERLERVRKQGWQVLELRNCGLTEIPPEVFTFQDLISLDLGNDDTCPANERNRITKIPAEIVGLETLTRINISFNNVSDITPRLSELSKLNHLNLRGNMLTDLPPEVATMPSLKQLILDDNPFEMLPPEIVARGVGAIQNFYKELEEKDFLYEVKLLIVGEGRVGKTCLSKALIHSDYRLETEESTEGINIQSWIIPKEEIATVNPKIQRDFQINVWDFGGQEIYHSTHQFFLTKRSMYMLVTESRKEDSRDDFFYWLNIIKLLGDRSPVVMVLNKCDQPTKDLPIKEYKELFSNILDLYKVSLKDSYRDSLNHFKDKLKYVAAHLPHIGTPLPKTWVDIRREIEVLKQSGKNYITANDYLEICKKHYRKEESAWFLSDYFHDLGVLLHFKDDIHLKDIVILNHEWITTGVYKILDDENVIQQKGVFTNDDLYRIWCNEEYKNKLGELISLMKNEKFDLCFEMSPGKYLIPRLLPVDEIDNIWFPSEDDQKFEFHYKFMPKGILARLIVKLSGDILDNKYWRHGVLLQYDGTKALVRERYFENRISIYLAGKNRREYLFSIRKVIKEIHKDFNNLVVNEMVPCNCGTCRGLAEPVFYDYDFLQRLAYAHIRTTRCTRSLSEVDVYSLMSEIIRSSLGPDRLVVCENLNAELLKSIALENVFYYPERDSNSVFIQIKTHSDRYGLRDRDFLLDSEIERLKNRYPNYFILDYYCFENYLYHPDNIAELKFDKFDKEAYTNDIISQKNAKKSRIISVFKQSRSSYQELKISEDKIRDKENEDKIIEYLDSNDIEVFFKAFSMKDNYSKDYLKHYNPRQATLANTNWFKLKIQSLLKF